MGESYSAGDASGAGRELARELLAQLIPSADARLLVDALMAERAARMAPPPPDLLPRPVQPPPPDPADRELRRLRAQLEAGESARSVQHAINNPLTALIAEGQLLELEPLAREQLLAVGRMIELARRIAKATRRLGAPAG